MKECLIHNMKYQHVPTIYIHSRHTGKAILTSCTLLRNMGYFPQCNSAAYEILTCPHHLYLTLQMNAL